MKKILPFLALSAASALFVVGSPASSAGLSSHLPFTIQLATAGEYQVLAGAALTVGASVDGLENDAIGVSSDAVVDLSAAIASISGVGGTTGTADLGGLTYAPGVHLSPGGAAIAVTGDVVLDGQNDPNSSFFFYTPAALNTTASITMTLINGAQAKNVYWIAGGAITTGASDILVGTFMSNAAITTGASSIITGRLLAAAAVTVGASNIFLRP